MGELAKFLHHNILFSVLQSAEQMNVLIHFVFMQTEAELVSCMEWKNSRSEFHAFCSSRAVFMFCVLYGTHCR